MLSAKKKSAPPSHRQALPCLLPQLTIVNGFLCILPGLRTILYIIYRETNIDIEIEMGIDTVIEIEIFSS